LLIVGSNDLQIIELNEEALRLLRCEKDLVIIPGAIPLFEEPGAVDEVGGLARGWFLRHLTHKAARLTRAAGTHHCHSSLKPKRE
jgi:putative phosphoribosyl transferase